VLLGCSFVRRSRSTEEFTAAGRRLPGWAVGLSIFGTYVSSISFLAYPGKSYSGNWNAFVFSLSLPVAAWIAVRFFVPLYRRVGAVSAYKQLEDRFGPWARVYATCCYLLTQIARVATILYLVGLALSPLLGWDIKSLILVSGGLVTIYTLLGGIEAVIWTDVLQSLVLGAGMIASVVVLLVRMPGGPQAVFSVAAGEGKFSLGSFSLDFTESTFWVVLLYGLVTNLQNFGIDQSYVQRYITAESDKAARKSVWLGALLYIPISAILLFIGTALFAFYRDRPELLVGPQGPITKADGVFPHFIVAELPPGVTGLLIAAVLAAAMSSVDSSLNSSATLILSDLYKRFLRPRAGEREEMAVLYGATLLWGLVGTAAALAMIRVKSALEAWWNLAGVFSGGMVGLFLLGLIVRRARSLSAALATCTGVILILWMSLSQTGLWPEFAAHLRSPFHMFMTTVIGTAAILCVGFVLSLLLPWKRNGGSFLDRRVRGR